MMVCFRVDSSAIIGTGHVTRCLTLAEQFRNNGDIVTFICRELPGNVIELISATGFEVKKLPRADYGNLNQDELGRHKNWLAVDWETDYRQTKEIIESLSYPVDLLVADHYALEENWEEKMASHCGSIMMIDDLADRRHHCNLLLDQNYYKNLERRYDKLVPTSCHKMLGPSYALLRPEFYKTRQNMKRRNGKIEQVMVFFGGSDSSNQTGKVLKAISTNKFDAINFDIVIGSTNPYRSEIETICASINNFTLHCQIDYMADLMAQSDLSIGGGGTTTWERCCLGLPSITIALAENQKIVAELSHEIGFAIYLGYHTDIFPNQIAETLLNIIEQPDKLIKMSRRGQEFVDGMGASRVIENILKFIGFKSNIKI